MPCSPVVDQVLGWYVAGAQGQEHLCSFMPRHHVVTQAAAGSSAQVVQAYCVSQLDIAAQTGSQTDVATGLRLPANLYMHAQLPRREGH